MTVISIRKSNLSGEILPDDVEIPTQIFIDSPFDNISFELDMTEDEFKKMVAKFQMYAKVGGDVHTLNTARKPRKDTESDGKLIRDWAKEMYAQTEDVKYRVNERGAIPNAVRALYDARDDAPIGDGPEEHNR